MVLYITFSEEYKSSLMFNLLHTIIFWKCLSLNGITFDVFPNWNSHVFYAATICRNTNQATKSSRLLYQKREIVDITIGHSSLLNIS